MSNALASSNTTAHRITDQNPHHHWFFRRPGRSSTDEEIHALVLNLAEENSCGYTQFYSLALGEMPVDPYQRFSHLRSRANGEQG